MVLSEKNNREANDFELIMNYAKLFSRSKSDFEDEIEQVVHVDNWLRGMSYAVPLALEITQVQEANTMACTMHSLTAE